MTNFEKPTFIPPKIINGEFGGEVTPGTGVWVVGDKPADSVYDIYNIPRADSGEDNKYDFVNSLIAQGATYADGTPLDGTDRMWGQPVFVPKERSDPGKIVNAVDLNPKEEDGWLGLGGFGDALFLGAMVTVAGWAAGAWGAGAAGGAGAGASTAGAGSALSDIAAFEAASATVPAATGGGIINTALTGAGKSALINSGVQLATTGKIDLKKTAVSAAAGGFGSVIGDYVGNTLELGSTAGQLAGAVTGAVVGGALSDTGAAVSGAVGAGTSTGASTNATSTNATPAVNNAGFGFGDVSLKFKPVARATNWSTPRMNWSA